MKNILACSAFITSLAILPILVLSQVNTTAADWAKGDILNTHATGAQAIAHLNADDCDGVIVNAVGATVYMRKATTGELIGFYATGDIIENKPTLIKLKDGKWYVFATSTDGKLYKLDVAMIEVRKTFEKTLTEEALFTWHKMLLPGSRNITVGTWRSHNEPMQVVSGAVGKEKVHFEAPPSTRVSEEMRRFLDWFNKTAPGGSKPIRKAPVRAAIAHLYFETIHPFEDGNGRIGRAIAEKALSQGIGRPALISLSRTIEANRKAFYDALQKAQTSNEITHWLHYFVHTILQAQTESEQQIEFTLKKVKFFERFKEKFSDRQLKVIKRMLEEGPEGFAGGMNASKYGSITRISKATATRDLQHLLEMGAIAYLDESGGRSTRYRVQL